MERNEYKTWRVVLMTTACVASVVVGNADERPPLPFHAGSETLVVIPDTEGYTNKRPEQLTEMMRWVAHQQQPRNIQYLLHVGDVTNNNTEREWRHARKSFDVIEGKLRYVLAVGNHDYDGTPGRLSHMSAYFPVADLQEWPTFGDVYEEGKLDNHYQFLSLHGRDWIVLSLEMGPRKEVLEWANRVLTEHKHRLAIVLTHAYLYYGNQRYDHQQGKQRASPHNYYGDGADGEQLWNQLIRRHPNVMLVICGHLSSGYVGYRADEADYGNVVHQMMVDYEKMRGGMGYLRLLEFLPDGKRVQVRTYSPLTGGRNPRDPKLEEFVFELQTATRDTPKQVDGRSAALRKPPLHRYRFDGRGGDGARVVDSMGRAHGTLAAHGSKSTWNGDGQLVLEGEGRVSLPSMLDGLEDVSFELWMAPLADSYRWHSAVRFGDAEGWFHYCHRNFGTVRAAEIAVRRHNEDIQLPSAAEVGKPMHLVVTYDRDAEDGKSVVRFYRDGKRQGSMRTELDIADVHDTQNRIGPFAGRFDELRVYDFALSEEEVRGNWLSGPDVLRLPETDSSQRTR